MHNESNLKNLHISKLKIINKSGCAMRGVLWSACLFAATLIASFVSEFTSGNKGAETMFGVIFALLIICTFCALAMVKIYLEASTVFQVMTGKYTIITPTVLSIRLANKFSHSSNSFDRTLEFSNGMRLTADLYVIKKLPVGSKAVLVFINKNKYPIIIENAKDFGDNDETA